MSAVIRGSGAHLDGELDARTVRQLVRVHPKSEPVDKPRLQDLAGRVRAEGPLFAEDIAPPGLRRTGFEHRAGYECDVVLLPPAELGCHDVRAEKSDLLGDRLGNIETS